MVKLKSNLTLTAATGAGGGGGAVLQPLLLRASGGGGCAVEVPVRDVASLSESDTTLGTALASALTAAADAPDTLLSGTGFEGWGASTSTPASAALGGTAKAGSAWCPLVALAASSARGCAVGAAGARVGPEVLRLLPAVQMPASVTTFSRVHDEAATADTAADSTRTEATEYEVFDEVFAAAAAAQHARDTKRARTDLDTMEAVVAQGVAETVAAKSVATVAVAVETVVAPAPEESAAACDFEAPRSADGKADSENEPPPVCIFFYVILAAFPSF